MRSLGLAQQRAPDQVFVHVEGAPPRSRPGGGLDDVGSRKTCGEAPQDGSELGERLDEDDAGGRNRLGSCLRPVAERGADVQDGSRREAGGDQAAERIGGALDAHPRERERLWPTRRTNRTIGRA